MATAYSVLDSRDKNELNQTITNTKKELQGNIDTLETKHDNEVVELQEQVDTLEKNKATKAELSSHNTSNSAHNDIRLLIQNLTTRLNTLADSDDTTLDQMSEIVAYIETNRDLIESITTSKVSVSDIINNLTTNVSNKPLSAAMGITLKALIDAIPDNTNTIVDEKIAEHNVDADAHEDIRTDVLNAQSTASGAQTAAENAQSAADAAQADVDDALGRLNSLEVGSGKLDREVSTTDGIVTCEDALPDSGLIETRFYGKTVQNLWVNPNGTNGITSTANDDGSFTISGTSQNNRVDSDSVYTLKPSTTYVAYADKVITAQGGNASFSVRVYDSNSSFIEYFDIAGVVSSVPKIFTTSPNLASVKTSLWAGVDVTVSGTYRVMLREATEAEIAAAASTPQTLPVYPDDSGPDASNEELGIMPLNDVSTLSDTFDDYWCPPGLSSIDNVEIVTAGKNLFKDTAIGTINGITCERVSDGGFRLHGTSTARAQFSLSNYNLPSGKYTFYNGIGNASVSSCTAFVRISRENGELDFVDPYSTGTTTFEISSNDSIGAVVEVRGIGYTVDETLYPYIVPYGEENGFEIPFMNNVIINLQGYSLCSLPDGTRDELRIDKDGNVTLIQKIINTSFTADDILASHPEYCELIIGEASQGETYSGGVLGSINSKDTINDFAINVNPDNVQNLVKCWVYSLETNNVPTGNAVVRLGNGKAENSSNEQFNSVKSLIGNRTIRVLYKLKTPKTIQLGKIDLPRLPSSTSHVWINGTANTTNFALPINDLSVRYWLPNGELVADIYKNGATDEMSDDEIMAIWNGATGNIVEASNTDIEAIFD